jgi:hypothetical protein
LSEVGAVIEDVSAMQSALASQNVSNLYSGKMQWDGWGSNPRPADYESRRPAALGR